MFLKALFDGFIFPWLLCRNHEIIESGKGVIFPFSPNAEAPTARVEAARSPVGWSVCKSTQFAILRTPLRRFTGYSLVVFGLKIQGYSTRRGKSENRSIILERDEVENYIYANLRTIDAISSQLEKVLASEVHETRAINTDVMHIAENSISQIESGFYDIGTVKSSLLSIKALSEITAIRTDFLDFVSARARASVRRYRDTQPYRKFDKVRKSLERRALKNRTPIEIRGNSYSAIRALDIFDIIPYILIQNALKYTPKDNRIVVIVREYEAGIEFAVENLGPTVTLEENARIFEWGVRGEQASIFADTGSGIGLHFLREIVYLHDGQIIFQQDARADVIDGLPFSVTKVIVRFPSVEFSDFLEFVDQ